jgi:hypothetical protein
MASEALRHWVAYEATADLVKIVTGPATEQEKSALFGRIYDRLHDALTEFESKNNRLQRWTNPRWWN